MTALQRMLDGLGRRFIAWGTVLRQHDAPGSSTAATPPVDARRLWLDRVAHLPPEAWRSAAMPPTVRRPESLRPTPPWLPARGGDVRQAGPAAGRNAVPTWREDVALPPHRLGRLERFFRHARRADEHTLRTPWMDVLWRLRRPAPALPPRYVGESARAQRLVNVGVESESRRSALPAAWPPVATPPGPPETWWPASPVARAVRAAPPAPDRAGAPTEPITAPLRYDYGDHRRHAPVVWPVGTEEPSLPRRPAFEVIGGALPDHPAAPRVAPSIDAAPPRAGSAPPYLNDTPARPWSELPPWPVPTVVQSGIDALARERRRRVDDEQRG